jgi:uncharacterized membrane protein YesL
MRDNETTLMGEAKAWLSDAYFTSIPLILANVVWFLLSLPVVTLFPALVGLFYATNQVAHDRASGGRAVWEGLRAYFWVSWRWGLIFLAGLLIGGVNLWFYQQSQAEWIWLLAAVFLTLSVMWISVNLYVPAFLIEQVEPSLRTAYRNSLALWVRRPLNSALLVVACALLLYLSVAFFPMAVPLITAAFCAYLVNRSVVESIAMLGERGGEEGE